LIHKFLLAGAVALVLAGCSAPAAPSLAELCRNGNDYACTWWDYHDASGEPLSPAPAASGRSEIALYNDGGTFTVPVSINGAITLDFTIDSGATDVSIPADVVMTLMRTGTIDRSDFLGNRTYVMADGSAAPSPTFRTRSLRVGNREVRNVTGSIAPVKGDLLLGQSFLRQFGSWSIDNRRGVLVLD
jgi:predicted aspartyl protease